MYELFSGQTANGTSDAVQLVNAGVDRDWTAHVSGTLGGGAVKLQLAPDEDGPWVDLDGASFTAELAKTFTASRLWWVRADLSGATDPNVTVGIL